jgi:hypothetical protein
MKLRRPAITLVAAMVVLAACANDHDRAAPTTSSTTPSDTEVGVAYPFQLYAHCTPTYATFGGTTWKVEHPVPDPPGEPFARGSVDYLSGTMRLTAADELTFTVDDTSHVIPGAVVTFRPTEESPPLCH